MSSYKNVVLITGGARGIGAAAARALASPDTAIAITYNTSRGQADATLAALRTAGVGAAVAIQADLSTPAGATHAVTSALTSLGATKLTALVNNAGVWASSPIEGVTEALYAKIFDANVKAAVLVTAAAAPVLVDGGAIVNVSSIVSKAPTPGITVYAASKAALEGLTRALAVELAPRRIRVNAVSPGFTATDMFPEAHHGMAAGLTPFGRVGTPEDIGKAIAFFVGEGSGWITGQTINVSGGIGYAL
ncbi:hypothetical protein HDU96_002679 [Phlyctochytrium bullatum]|nr:hypothetical protein HDU96_002679 [Phlyctochytrium bullatum]